MQVIAELTSWWSGRSRRERLVMLAGAALVGLMLSWALIWHPLANARENLAQRVEDQQRLLQWMRSASEDVQRARTTVAAGAGSNQSLFALADESLRAHGLADAIRRIEPEGRNRVRLWLDDARFDDLMDWTVTLHRGHGVVVDEMSAQATDSPGMVNASLVVRR